MEYYYLYGGMYEKRTQTWLHRTSFEVQKCQKQYLYFFVLLNRLPNELVIYNCMFLIEAE